MSESDLVDMTSTEMLGSSGGALTAVGLVLGLDFDEIADLALSCVARTHGSVRGAFDLRTYVRETLAHQFAAYHESEGVAAEEKVELANEGSCSPSVTNEKPPGLDNRASDRKPQPSHNRSRWEHTSQVTTTTEAMQSPIGSASASIDTGSRKSVEDIGDNTADDIDVYDNDDDNDDKAVEGVGAAAKRTLQDALAGKVTVSVTTLPWLRNKRYSTFDSPEHVTEVLVASCTATPIAGMPFMLDGELVLDGGLADFQPLSASLPRAGTVTVSPFYFVDADIRPSRYVPLWWAVYPPRREDFAWVFHLGYDDARAWLAQLEHRGKAKDKSRAQKKAEHSGSGKVAPSEMVKTPPVPPPPLGSPAPVEAPTAPLQASFERPDQKKWCPGARTAALAQRPESTHLRPSVDPLRFPSDATKWALSSAPRLLRRRIPSTESLSALLQPAAVHLRRLRESADNLFSGLPTPQSGGQDEDCYGNEAEEEDDDYFFNHPPSRNEAAYESSTNTSCVTSAATSATATPYSIPLFPTATYTEYWPYGTRPDSHHSLNPHSTSADHTPHLGGAEHEDNKNSSIPFATKASIRHTSYAGRGRHSFGRVFGYRSVLQLVPSRFLDLFLVLWVYLAIQPLAFVLVYAELLVRTGIATLGLAVDWAIMQPLAHAASEVHALGDTIRNGVSATQARAETVYVRCSGAFWQRPPEKIAVAAAAVENASQARAADAAVAKSLRRQAERVRRRERRARSRQLRSMAATLVNPTLWLRMVPVIGKPLTGKAYRLRRKLCEFSVFYRICVHFL